MTTEQPPNPEALRALQSTLLGSIERTRAEITRLEEGHGVLRRLVAFLLAQVFEIDEVVRLLAQISILPLEEWAKLVYAAVEHKSAEPETPSS